MTSILVLGAGELGLSMLHNLARLAPTDTTITVLLRQSTINSPSTPTKQTELDKLKALGIRFLPGDVVNISSSDLSALFRPYHTVISCVGFVAGSSIQLKIAHAILDAGVARYLPWQFGVDYDVIGRGSAQELFDVQLDVRDLLRGQSKTEWVIVSTGMFTSFLFERSFGVVNLDESVVRALGSWETTVTVTTPEDIGALTAEIVFMENPRFRNEVVFTAGDTVTYGRVADIVESVLGREVRREKWSVEFLKRELAKDPENSLKKYRVVFAEGRGVSWDLEKSFNWKDGKEVVDVERWLRENLKR
ncbi:MAG: aromatic alcohol reductase [Nostoc sp.]|uniref:aromatic alcohol reductase n=1 Tax=Nostoc sp. TaxID=1180 RepID=UPI002FF13260